MVVMVVLVVVVVDHRDSTNLHDIEILHHSIAHLHRDEHIVLHPEGKFGICICFHLAVVLLSLQLHMGCHAPAAGSISHS